MTTQTETPVTTTFGRMPTIAFSDDADYDAIGTLFWKMEGFVWQVEMSDGTSITGEVRRGPNDNTVTVIPDEGYHPRKSARTVTLHLYDIVRFIYL